MPLWQWHFSSTPNRMKLLWLNFLAVISALIAISADEFGKTWTFNKRSTFLFTALFLYLLSDVFWLYFLRDVRLSVAVAWWEAIAVVPAIFVGILYFKERLTVYEVIAVLLVLIGIIMLNLSHAKI